MKTYNTLDLADAQFIGFIEGKYQDIISLVESMGLTKEEWEQWKKDYLNILRKNDYQKIEEYFEEE